MGPEISWQNLSGREQLAVNTLATKPYGQSLAAARESIGASWIFIEIDEARIGGRRIISVLAGALNGENPLSYFINIV